MTLNQVFSYIAFINHNMCKTLGIKKEKKKKSLNKVFLIVS